MKNPVVTISTTMADRGLALEVLNATHSASDNVLRHQALARTSSYIEYLSGRLQLATGVEYRQAIADSIVEQEKVRMKAASVLPFSAEIFARPTVSLLPTAPNASKVLMISALIGVLMGVVGAVFCQRMMLDNDPREWARKILRR